MDPNETLNQLRELSARLLERIDSESFDLKLDLYDVYDLAIAVRNIDYWLTQGGSLPYRWQALSENKNT